MHVIHVALVQHLSRIVTWLMISKMAASTRWLFVAKLRWTVDSGRPSPVAAGRSSFAIFREPAVCAPILSCSGAVLLQVWASSEGHSPNSECARQLRRLVYVDE